MLKDVNIYKIKKLLLVHIVSWALINIIMIVSGEYRSISIQSVSSVGQVAEVVAVATKGHQEDLQDPVQGVGRAGVAGRLLLESRGLVRAECAQRGAG